MSARYKLHLVAQFVGGLTKADLMGELALMHTLPTYHINEPHFSPEVWRQLEYANGLIGTTL